MKCLLLGLLLMLAATITSAVSNNIRLSTYCSTHNNCPPNSECNEHNYCQCYSGYSPPDRKLDSCHPTKIFPKLYDARFSDLETVCKQRLNCPPNSYCDPVGFCTCYPGWVTLDYTQCVFEELRVVADDDIRWRSTGMSCRSTVNCMENAECSGAFCRCREGYDAAGRIGDGFFADCVPSTGAPTGATAIVLLGAALMAIVF